VKLILKNFFQDEQGQDLVEYTLLMGFVAIAVVALFVGASASVSSIWAGTNSQLSAAAASAAS
jgi:Flp pilus assembly pilin Flp